MRTGRRRRSLWPISVLSSHSQGHSHIWVTMVMLIRWLMTIHQWCCLIGLPLRALKKEKKKQSVQLVSLLYLRFPPKDGKGGTQLLSVCFSPLVSPSSPHLSSLLYNYQSHPFFPTAGTSTPLIADPLTPTLLTDKSWISRTFDINSCLRGSVGKYRPLF